MAPQSSSAPRVSVVMTVFNGATHLREAMDSILSQTMPAFELIVVDDASTDSSAEILADYLHHDQRVRILRNDQNIGPYDSANRGLEASRGSYIARMDSDDRCWKDRLERQTRFLDEHPDHLLVGCGYRSIGENGGTRFIKRNPMDDRATAWTTRFRMPSVHPGFCFRSKLADGSLVRYRGGRTIAQDFAFASQLARHGKTAVLDAILVDYRMHGANISSQRLAEQRLAARQIAIENLQAHYPRKIADDLTVLLNVLYRTEPGTTQRLQLSVTALTQAIEFDARQDSLPVEWLHGRAAGILAEAFLGTGTIAKRVGLSGGYLVHAYNFVLPLLSRLIELRRLSRPVSAEELRAQPAGEISRTKQQ